MRKQKSSFSQIYLFALMSYYLEYVWTTGCCLSTCRFVQCCHRFYQFFNILHLFRFPQQATTNPFEQAQKPVYAPLALGVHSCTLYFQKQPLRIEKWYMKSVHLTAIDLGKITVMDFNFNKASSFQPATLLKTNFSKLTFQGLSPRFSERSQLRMAASKFY